MRIKFVTTIYRCLTCRTVVGTIQQRKPSGTILTLDAWEYCYHCGHYTYNDGGKDKRR